MSRRFQMAERIGRGGSRSPEPPALDGTARRRLSVAARDPRTGGGAARGEIRMARKREGQTALVTGASMAQRRRSRRMLGAGRLRPDPHGALRGRTGRVATRLSAAHGPGRRRSPATSASRAAAPRWRRPSTGRGQQVDVLANNAGHGIAGAFNGSDRASQLGMIDLNDRALVELPHFCRACWRTDAAACSTSRPPRRSRTRVAGFSRLHNARRWRTGRHLKPS
jgi:hypothetical protein